MKKILYAYLPLLFLWLGCSDQVIESPQYPCSPDGAEETRFRFEESVASPGSQCVYEEQVRTCENGNWGDWSGTFTAKSCSDDDFASCGTIAHGSSENRNCYDADSVSAGSTCTYTTQTRTCNDGTWDPDWPYCDYLSCQVEGFENCDTTAHGNQETRNCYDFGSVPTGSTCTFSTQTRTCNDGTWDPDWPYCAHTSCIIESPAVTAQIHVFSTQGMAPFTILFDGSSSTANQGDIVDYYWDFNDANSQYERYDTGRLAGHRFETPGTYTVSLVAIDDQGNSSLDSIDIEILSAPLDAVTYYVANPSNGGDNANDGLCPTDEGTCGPWATFDYAISQADSMPDGSKILFHRGDTFSPTIDFTEFNATNIGPLMKSAPYYITIGSYGTGDKPLFNAGFCTGYVAEGNGIVIDDIHLAGRFMPAPTYYSGSGTQGFRYPGHQAQVRNCIFDDGFGGWSPSGAVYENILVDSASGSCGDDFQAFTEYVYWNNVTILNAEGHGVYFASELIDPHTPASRILIENSEFAYNGLGANLRDGFTIHGFVNNFIFRNNNVHHNGYGLGWDSAYAGNTIEFNRNFILEDSIIHDQVYYTTQFSSQQNFVIRNNLFVNNPSCVLSIGTPNNYDGYLDEDSFNIHIYNNVFYNNHTGYQGSMIHFEQDQVHDVYFYNNILSHNTGMDYLIRDDDADDLTMSNNLYHNNSPLNYFLLNSTAYALEDWISSDTESGLVNADPQFVDASNTDFHLQSTSPAINTGINANSLWDADGNARPEGTSYDIGAYEYQ